MTVALAVSLQAAVFTVVNGSASSLPVYDHAPTPRPVEFIRLDGFSITDMGVKNGDIARHAFEVHYFYAPSDGSTYRRGQTRAKTVLATIHAALMAASVLSDRISHEYMDVAPDVDGVTAHGMSRYTIIL